MTPVLPGATLGVLGSGQLGRMLAQVARRLGYRVLVYSPFADTPAGQLADEEVCAAYDDAEALAAFARRCGAITVEFENIPAAALETCAAFAPVRPGPGVLHVAQNRLREKTFLRDHGFPVAPFARVDDLAGLERALAELGAPAVLKTAGFGYDGKGQRVVKGADEARAAYRELGGGTLVLEAFVRFEREVSVVAARGLGGETRDFGVIDNYHALHILDLSVAPSSLPARRQAEARELARALLETLDVVGVLCAELFVTEDGALLVNELAPRPHNSGHLTIEACLASQFEQQLRAVCGLPLGVSELRQPAAMANLLGDLWRSGEPDWLRVLATDVRLHLYGKAEARPGRKMGHLTALAGTPGEAREKVLAARACL